MQQDNIPLIIANIAHALDKKLTPQEYSDLQNILHEEKKEEQSYTLSCEPVSHVWFNGCEYAPVSEISTAEKETKRKIRAKIERFAPHGTSGQWLYRDDILSLPELQD